MEENKENAVKDVDKEELEPNTDVISDEQEEEINPYGYDNIMSYFWILIDIPIFSYNTFVFFNNIRVGDGYLYVFVALIINIGILVSYGQMVTSKFTKIPILIPYILLGVVGLLGMALGCNSDILLILALLALFAVVVLPLYFLPGIIAIYRNHQFKWIILLINAFSGWMGIGYVVAMIWAVLPENTIFNYENKETSKE